MDRSPRKKWIRIAIAAFLCLMLLLTFFSNSIRNWSLPEVETAVISSGTLTTEIRETTSVTAINEYRVSLPQSREVVGIHISLGDTVKPGDLLFTLSEEEGETLDALREELDQMKLEYSKALLDQPLPAYAVENSEIQALQNELENAVAERSALGEAKTTLTAAQVKQSAAQSALDQLNAEVSKIEGKLTSLETNDVFYQPIRQEVLALEAANSELAQRQSAYDAVVEEHGGQGYASLTLAIAGLESEIAGMESGIERDRAQQRLESLREDFKYVSAAYSSLREAQDEVALRSGQLEEKKNAEQKVLLKEYDAAVSQQETAKANLEKAKAEYEEVRQIKEAEASVTATRNALQTRILALQDQQDQDQTAQKRTNLEIDRMLEQIEKKEQELAELEQGAGAEVRAVAGGVVSSLSAQIGTVTPAGEVLAEISMTDAGFEAVIPVSSQQANKIALGTAAQVFSTLGLNEAVTAEVTAIRADVEGSSDQKLVALTLQGDLNMGQTLTFSIPQDRQDYAQVIPKSAVYEDEAGHFVFAVQTKKSPLGNRYFVEKERVTVLAQDGVQAAIENGPGTGERVVTRADGILKGGDFVRLSQDTGGL